ncbi:nicotinate-nucleotide adenylyltransferase [Listeria costaricensis]|uniref:nicotinate-nucleotide adenylyltransferase n=1 Tax=Listeria costaricensis TaxID=2026604 RepID=UPI000C07794A|nr:nicotinate-nucleotide adenylyltransferase [Listeria costaricensis]
MKKKIGILGGTFDPPHLTHLSIVEAVQKKLHLDQVIFLPNAIPPHKEASGLVSDADRLQMLQLSTADKPSFTIDQRELLRQGKSYTYETMKEMTSEHPEIDYYFIIGGDMVEYLPKWYQIDQLLKLVHFVGVNRPNYPLSTPYPIIWVEVSESDLSSTAIRERLQQGQPIDTLVPKSVAAYIKEHQLYETN